MAGAVLKKLAAAGDELVRQFYSKTPRERLADASERATFDPEDGGLGLAPGNTSYERMQLMFPTRVFHGGGGKQATDEQLRKVLGKQDMMFASDSGQVASSYAPKHTASRKFYNAETDPRVWEEHPDAAGNVMPLRIDDSDAAVIDYKGLLYSGFRTDDTPDGIDILNDAMITDVHGTPMLRMRRETQDGATKDMSYLPHEKPHRNTSLSLRRPYSTDELHSYSGYGIAEHYGKRPSMTRFDNIVDIGRHRHGEKPSERFIPSTVYAIRDGSKVRSEFAAFDPLFRNLSGLSLGASAAAVGALLDQLPPDESIEGALYADGER